MTENIKFHKFSAIYKAAISRGYKKLRLRIDAAKNIRAGLEKIVDMLLCPDGNCALSGDLTRDRRTLNMFIRDCQDVNFRDLVLGGRQALAFYLEGMVDMDRLEDLIGALQTVQKISVDNIQNLIARELKTAKVGQLQNISAVANAVAAGQTVVLVDGIGQALVFEMLDYPKRQISEARREAVVRGPYAGFNETLGDNLVLIRRRAADPKLKVLIMHIGKRTRTKVAVVYVEGLAKRALVDEVHSRLSKISVDKVLLSGEIEEFIIDSPWSPFPQTQATERPDKLVAALYEGRVGIVVDNTPWALVVPCNYNQLLQSTEDYTSQPLISSLVRLTRHISVFIAIFTPGIYVALTSYHTGVLPNSLTLTIAELRARAPFPSFLEALLMELILEIFQEATARLPDKIVVAASVVGGFVIGNTVVEAGLANPLLVVVTAVAAIASYTIPTYQLSLALRWFRMPVIIMAAIFGLYGVMVCSLFLLVHMAALTSFGESFFGPIFDVSMLQDWKDMAVRFPAAKLRVRPKVFGAEDRLKVDDSET